MKRRDFVRTGLAAGVGSLAAGACAPGQPPAAAPAAAPATGALAVSQGPVGPPLKQSVCKWCFPNLTVAQLAEAGRDMGLKSIELLGPNDWPTLRQYGLTCAMGSQPAPHSIARGFNRRENHEWLIPAYETRLREAADAGVPSVICFSGNRQGMHDAEGLENCAIGLARIMPTAERLGVNVVMELLNSKVNHADYMCDRTAWGVELAKKVGSNRFGLLYDIYHMQIMEGDVIRTIKENHPHLFHYHTAGNPGRNELDETQELYYPAIMRAIKETGFQGYIGQEFIPKREPLVSLRQAVEICNV